MEVLWLPSLASVSLSPGSVGIGAHRCGLCARVCAFLYADAGYLVDAKDFAANGRITGHFRPIGYSLLIGMAFRAAGIAGIVVLQSIVYISTVVAAFQVARRVCDIHWLILFATSLVAFHPYLLLDIKRVNDNTINVLGILAIVADVFLRASLDDRLGQVRGCSRRIVFVSPQCACFRASAHGPTVFEGFRLRGLLSMAATFIAAWMIISSIGTGNPFYIPDNGPYNLFAGVTSLPGNPLTNLNAEPMPAWPPTVLPPLTELFSPCHSVISRGTRALGSGLLD